MSFPYRHAGMAAAAFALLAFGTGNYAVLAAAAPAASPAATPAAPKLLGKYDGWSAYTLAQGKADICYVVGQPKASAPAKAEPAKGKKGKKAAATAPAKPSAAHLLVTHRPAEKAFNVVSVEPGYTYFKGYEPVVKVDGQTFSFFTDKGTAWSRDADTDKAVVTAMAKGKVLTVTGKPAKGPESTDTYTLAGFKEALGQIDKACKVKR